MGGGLSTLRDSRNPDVMAMVRQQLKRDPPPSLAALYGRAGRIDPAVKKLSLRQFNARYPLQVRRQQQRESKRAPARPSDVVLKQETSELPRPTPPGPEVHARLRSVLFEWAKLVSAAQTKAQLVAAIQEMDRFVDALLDLLPASAPPRDPS